MEQESQANTGEILPESALQLEKTYLMQTYSRKPALFTRGKGCFLYDAGGNMYLDLVAGVATNALGHVHPKWVKAVSAQLKKLVHTSNHYYTEPMIELAKELCGLSGMEKVFFCNSGTEANEAALKIARKWGRKKRGEECFKFISFTQGFHGRTMGSLSLTPTEKYRTPFMPLVPGMIHISWDDISSVESLLDGTVCAVIVETVQGEGGVRPISSDQLQKIRNLCIEKEVLLLCDEVQTGIGRTGKWFGFEQAGILPDVITLAKGLGGGIPIGACLARGDASTVLESGDHGSTFGGNPLACSSAISVINIIKEENILQSVCENGAIFRQELQKIVDDYPLLVSLVRGQGLILALELKKPAAREAVSLAMKEFLVINSTDDFTLRFVPPLIISKKEISMAVKRLRKVFDILKQS